MVESMGCVDKGEGQGGPSVPHPGRGRSRGLLAEGCVSWGLCVEGRRGCAGAPVRPAPQLPHGEPGASGPEAPALPPGPPALPLTVCSPGTRQDASCPVQWCSCSSPHDTCRWTVF